ncbi:MAG TPA: hypothetical protein VIK01_26700 [Polyangiaceae bacterium]
MSHYTAEDQARIRQLARTVAALESRIAALQGRLATLLARGAK